MAHELEIQNGIASIAYVGNAPWHRLGQQIAADSTVKEWTTAAGLDWTVSKQDIFLKSGDEFVTIEGKKALIRDTDKSVFDIVGHDWEPVQNYQAFEFFQEFTRANKLKLETAGSLRGGKDTWVLAKTNEGFTLPGGDVTEGYVLFRNPHQYAVAAVIIPTSVRVVCANTLGLSIGRHDSAARKLEARFNHVGEGKFSIASAKAQLGIITNIFQEYAEQAKFLASKTLREPAFDEYISAVYALPDPDKIVDASLRSRRREYNQRLIDGLRTIRDTAPGHDLNSGTWFSALQAVTHDVDYSPRRNVSDDRAVASAWLGAGAARKAFALQNAVEFAQAA